MSNKPFSQIYYQVYLLKDSLKDALSKEVIIKIKTTLEMMHTHDIIDNVWDAIIDEKL